MPCTRDGMAVGVVRPHNSADVEIEAGNMQQYKTRDREEEYRKMEDRKMDCEKENRSPIFLSTIFLFLPPWLGATPTSAPRTE